jgi:four helix bundle protein
MWQEAHKLCLMTYKLTKSFPDDERFSLISQMRRSSASIATNIAESTGRISLQDKKRFLNIAIGSLEELSYQGILSKDLSYIDEKQFEQIDDSIQRTGYLIHKYQKSLS